MMRVDWTSKDCLMCSGRLAFRQAEERIAALEVMLAEVSRVLPLAIGDAKVALAAIPQTRPRQYERDCGALVIDRLNDLLKRAQALAREES